MPSELQSLTNLVTRDLVDDDLDSLLALYHHLHADDEPIPSSVGSLWTQIVRDQSHIYLGAFIGDRLVSACNAALIPNLTRGARPYAVVENVVTHVDYRRRGIGAALMRELLARCWSHGCYKAMLMSGSNRQNSYEFYVSLGFDKTAKQAFIAKPPA